jgi:hypothetical protein
MQTHTHNNRRIVQHDDFHYDIEELRPDECGNALWVVIYCSEADMNRWTPTIPQETRVKNLIEQIPQEYRARATRECYGADDHEFERKLTAYVIGKTWETYPSVIDEAEQVDNGLTDDRPYRKATADGSLPFQR